MTPQMLEQKMDEANNSIYIENRKLVSSLVDVKIALNVHDQKLDDKIDEYKAKLVSVYF
jgi:hypothetical protein